MAQRIPCRLQRIHAYQPVLQQRLNSCKYRLQSAGASGCFPCTTRFGRWAQVCLGRRYHAVAATKESETTASTSSTTKDDVVNASHTVPSSSETIVSSTPDEELQIVTTTVLEKVVEKVAGAITAYAVVLGLAWLSDIDPTATLTWNDGAPLALGTAVAIPAIILIGLLFAPTIDLGLTAQQLRTICEVDEEQEDAILSIGSGLDDTAPSVYPDAQPTMTPEAIKQGIWFYQMHVLKPWFHAFEWSSVGLLLVVSGVSASARELLVRGLGGGALTSWYTGLLAGTTDVHNPIYWAKVFKLVNADTARWLAAATMTILQVSLSSGAAERAARFTRISLNRLDRVDAGSGIPVQRTPVHKLTIELQLGIEPMVQAEPQRTVLLELRTAEEGVVYWANMGVSGLLGGATNFAWAASGSLLGSYTTQVIIDSVVTCLQQLKATRLPEKELWDQVQKMQDEKGTQGTQGTEGTEGSDAHGQQTK